MADQIPEEFMGTNDHSQIVKGKRTKRQRLSSPPFGVTSSSSSGGGSGGGEGDYCLIPSPATSISEISTEEEEDMANCLILLAQGYGPRENEEGAGNKVERLSTPKFTDTAAMATTSKATGGFYLYACKTCNRTFPSFQALGGHRASHKKPKASMVEEKKTQIAPLAASIDEHDEEEGQFSKISPTTVSIHLASSNNNNNKSFHVNKANKVHECSICGSEFSSGQALGGHMRRHRTTSTNNINNQITMNMDTIISTSCSESQDTKKPRNILPLDLNLPAPEDIDHHHRDSSKFQFTSKQQGLVFSAPALVDCHY